MLILLLAGCAIKAQRTGLVSHDDGRLMLTESTGRTASLVVEGEGRWLRGLEDCAVTVEGPRLFKKMWVRDFSVDDAGDGSRPFVGLLRQHGSNLLVEDRTTGRPVLLNQVSAARLRDLSGRPVMLLGFVVGPQTIHVVQWRALDEPFERAQPL